MTEQIPPRMRPEHRMPYEQRFDRYSYNAGVSAAYAERDAERLDRSAQLNGNASDNAYGHDDDEAADLYEDMEHYAGKAAEALREYAGAARKIEAHYKALAEARGSGEAQ